jgi:hypothetical protein
MTVLKSLKYPEYNLVSRHWTAIQTPADTELVTDIIKEQISTDGGGAWSGKGGVYRHSDGTIDAARNESYIQALINKQRITHVGTKNKYRQRDLRPSFYDDEPTLRLKQLGSQSSWSPLTAAHEAHLCAERRRKHALTPKTYPLIHDHWEEALRGYPNSLEVALFLDGLRNGVCAYYDGQRKCPKRTPNYPLAPEQWEIVTREQDKDIAAGDSIGYFSEPPFVNAHVHPLGLNPQERRRPQSGRPPSNRPSKCESRDSKDLLSTHPLGRAP